MTTKTVNGQMPVNQALDDLFLTYGRLRVLVALVLRLVPAGPSVLPDDPRLRADIGLPPVERPVVVPGMPFTLWL